MRVLIVEDHDILGRNIKQYLEIKKIDSVIETDGEKALYLALTEYFDLIILDLNLPSLSGEDICRSLREKGKDIPILMLTSRSMRNDIISGLGLGADDYMTKPFDYEELLARIEALVRRNLTNKSTTNIHIHGYTIHLDKKTVEKEGENIKLSHLEFDLFHYFATNTNKIISRQELYEKVWGEYDEFSMGKTVDVYIGYVRKKMGKEIIETKKGFGYIMNK